MPFNSLQYQLDTHRGNGWKIYILQKINLRDDYSTAPEQGHDDNDAHSTPRYSSLEISTPKQESDLESLRGKRSPFDTQACSLKCARPSSKSSLDKKIEEWLQQERAVDEKRFVVGEGKGETKRREMGVEGKNKLAEFQSSDDHILRARTVMEICGALWSC
ncbi:hypothetical protein C8R44DRAFT_741140 [Mycena epipterygia]|nr:hypothetical protein C8R44DRAFT_741140 [Mycena epipterygia]